MWGFTKMLFERAALEFGYFECGALEPRDNPLDSSTFYYPLKKNDFGVCTNDDLTAKAKLKKCGNDGGTGDGSGNMGDILMLAVIVKTRIEVAARTLAVTVMMVKCGWLHSFGRG